MIAIVNIGSNLGDRRLNLSKAMKAIGDAFGSFEMSHAVETEAEGFESNNKFLNLCMLFQTDLEAEALMQKLLEIEKSICPDSHRHADGSYRDRKIDIDLLALDDQQVDTPTVTLPHPRLSERRFYLEPMAEIAPGWRHPVSGLTPEEMLHGL